MEWISVKTQLPPENIRVIGWHDGIGLTGKIYQLNGRWYADYHNFIPGKITHWCLPSPPKE